ncbi:hypothetical protein PG996_011075 [Apiospora saccharicola]|uniref:Uncharacterized protein n=1 Tax=Apiospora saccharicola TaxID=335842 RepID=A0ABR1UGT0_9PEZI
MGCQSGRRAGQGDVDASAGDELDGDGGVFVDQVDGPQRVLTGQDGVGVQLVGLQEGIDVLLEDGDGRGTFEAFDGVRELELVHGEVLVDAGGYGQPAHRPRGTCGGVEGDEQHVGPQGLWVPGQSVVLVLDPRICQAVVVGGGLPDIPDHGTAQREPVELALQHDLGDDEGSVAVPARQVVAPAEGVLVHPLLATQDEQAEPIVQGVLPSIGAGWDKHSGQDTPKQVVDDGRVVLSDLPDPFHQPTGLPPDEVIEVRRPRETGYLAENGVEKQLQQLQPASQGRGLGPAQPPLGGQLGNIQGVHLEGQLLHVEPPLGREEVAPRAREGPHEDVPLQSILFGPAPAQLLDHVGTAVRGGEEDGRDQRGVARACGADGPVEVVVEALLRPDVQVVLDDVEGRAVADGVLEQRQPLLREAPVAALPQFLVLGVEPVKGEVGVFEDARVGLAEDQLVDGREVPPQLQKDIPGDGGCVVVVGTAPLAAAGPAAAGPGTLKVKAPVGGGAALLEVKGSLGAAPLALDGPAALLAVDGPAAPLAVDGLAALLALDGPATLPCACAGVPNDRFLTGDDMPVGSGDPAPPRRSISEPVFDDGPSTTSFNGGLDREARALQQALPGLGVEVREHAEPCRGDLFGGGVGFGPARRLAARGGPEYVLRLARTQLQVHSGLGRLLVGGADPGILLGALRLLSLVRCFQLTDDLAIGRGHDVHWIGGRGHQQRGLAHGYVVGVSVARHGDKADR